MSRYADLKAGPARFTADDADLWRDLVAAVRRALDAFGREGASASRIANLRRILKAAKAARVAGEVGAGNVCILLSRTAGRWADETTRGRRELAADLGDLADRVEALVEVFDPRSARRERKDIDG